MHNLRSWGYDPEINLYIQEKQLDHFTCGRVIKQNKGRYLVQVSGKSVEAELTGNMLFAAEDRSVLPAVGDWVLMTPFEELFVINQVLPRKGILQRKSVGAYAEKQVIAANIRYAFIVQGLDQDFNLNRLERYLTVAYSGGIEPVVLLNKADLKNSEEKQAILGQIKRRMGTELPVVLISVYSGEGIKQLYASLQPGRTYCLLGSSGVGKSSILNVLLGRRFQQTKEVSEATHKGKHTTTSRELMLLENGAMIIDTPGMRELGMVNDSTGVEKTFDQIIILARSCKFKDCSHENEPGCAVREAVDKGQLEEVVLENFRKLQRESQRFQTSLAEKRKADRALGKVYKDTLAFKRRNKF